MLERIVCFNLTRLCLTQHNEFISHFVLFLIGRPDISTLDLWMSFSEPPEMSGFEVMAR